ncbi:hypothetical protein M8756_16730 [Lutimaribacter sp. EGI FJ00015]|nr:hypothetical protein [Lutimaribacter sp. EGI FJ00015]MCO0637650.1 hypothetical protein [Lutimaribacter sp. EGI FJ00014]
MPRSRRRQNCPAAQPHSQTEGDASPPFRSVKRSAGCGTACSRRMLPLGWWERPSLG